MNRVGTTGYPSGKDEAGSIYRINVCFGISQLLHPMPPSASMGFGHGYR